MSTIHVLRRVAPGYDAARRASVADARCPEREPDAIVRARSDTDVLDAVTLAVERGWRIGVRSGGHSWAEYDDDVAILTAHL